MKDSRGKIFEMFVRYYSTLHSGLEISIDEKKGPWEFNINQWLKKGFLVLIFDFWQFLTYSCFIP